MSQRFKSTRRRFVTTAERVKQRDSPSVANGCHWCARSQKKAALIWEKADSEAA